MIELLQTVIFGISAGREFQYFGLIFWRLILKRMSPNSLVCLGVVGGEMFHATIDIRPVRHSASCLRVKSAGERIGL